jgi:predicted O-methyltransferase YrrM
MRDYISQKKGIRVLEFGSGASTAWFDRNQDVTEIISVEHDEEWFNLLKKELSPKTQLNFLPQPYDTICNGLSGQFDVIVVDGRNRNRCFKSSIDLLKIGGILIFDNTERRYYQPSFDLWKNKKLGTVTRFRQEGPDITGWKSQHREGYWETSIFEKK